LGAELTNKGYDGEIDGLLDGETDGLLDGEIEDEIEGELPLLVIAIVRLAFVAQTLTPM
jgi:hypothetical protein